MSHHQPIVAANVHVVAAPAQNGNPGYDPLGNAHQQYEGGQMEAMQITHGETDDRMDHTWQDKVPAPDASGDDEEDASTHGPIQKFLDSQLVWNVMEISTIIFGIIGLVTCWQAIFIISDAKSHLAEIQSNWVQVPITDVAILSNTASCPTGYSSQGTLLTWPGSTSACGCGANKKDSFGNIQTSSFTGCNSNQTAAGCVASSSTKQILLSSWKGSKLCFSREGGQASSVFDGYASGKMRPSPPSCPSGYHICGTGNYDQNLATCAPDDEKTFPWPSASASTGCPLTFLTSTKTMSQWSGISAASFTAPQQIVASFKSYPSSQYLYGAAGTDVVPQLPIVELRAAFVQPCMVTDTNSDGDPIDETKYDDAASLEDGIAYPDACDKTDTRWRQYDSVAESDLLFENFAAQEACVAVVGKTYTYSLGGATTSGSTTLTITGAYTTALVAKGITVTSSTGSIPAGTTVISVDSSTSITLSAAATATGASLLLTFTGTVSTADLQSTSRSPDYFYSKIRCMTPPFNYPCASTAFNSTQNCLSGDKACGDAFFQSACGSLLYYAKPTIAKSAVGLYSRSEIPWKTSCPYTKVDVNNSNKPLSSCYTAQLTLAIINTICQLFLIFMAARLLLEEMGVCDLCMRRGHTATFEELKAEEAATVPAANLIARLLILAPCISALYFATKIASFYVTLSHNSCTDAVSNDAFQQLGEALPRVVQSDSTTLAMIILQTLAPLCIFVFHKIYPPKPKKLKASAAPHP